jgi:uncharacterized membrane protein YhaH (DUF805 family)
MSLKGFMAQPKIDQPTFMIGGLILYLVTIAAVFGLSWIGRYAPILEPIIIPVLGVLCFACLFALCVKRLRDVGRPVSHAYYRSSRSPTSSCCFSWLPNPVFDPRARRQFDTALRGAAFPAK